MPQVRGETEKKSCGEEEEEEGHATGERGNREAMWVGRRRRDMLQVRGEVEKKSTWWENHIVMYTILLNARLQYLLYVNDGDNAVLH